MESTNKTLAYASGLIPLILGLFSIAAPAESYGHEISQLAPGGSCNAKYATPCARANGRWLAETVASLFEDALRSDDSSRRTRAVLESITSKELNRDLGFYPFVFSRETEKCVAHGAHEEFVGMSIEEIFDSVHLSYAHPDALYERFMAAHRDWIPYLWSDDGQGAHDKLAYIVNNLTDVSGDQSYFLGVGYENEPLPLDLPCSDKYDRWCSLTNVESLVGRAQFELEQANSRVDLERTMYRISNDEKRYKAPEGFYLFMYSFSGNLVASGTLPDSSFGKSLSEIFVDMKLGTAEEGQALHETLRDAVSGDNPVTWVQYPWRDSPDGDSFRKVAFLVKVQFGDELFYIGSGFRFAVDKIFAAPLGEVCSDEYNLPCSFHIAHQLSSHCLTHVTSSSLPREQVFEMITRDPDFRHDDFYLFVYSFDGVCMAHGGDETFVGMRLDGDDGVFNKVGIPLNATELDARFREAAATGGGWVTYDWVNLANLGGPTFKKITYIFQITIDNEDYYGGIGFNHLRHPLEEFSQRGFKMNGEPIPCSRKFGDKCSEINARSILGQALAMLTLSSSEASAVEVMSLVELDRYPGASSGGPVTTAKTPIDQVFKDISSKDPNFRVNDFSASVFSFGSNQACGINDGSGCAVAHGSNKYMGLTWNQILELEDASTIQGSLLHHNLIDASNSGAGSYKLPYQGTNMRAWVAQFKHEGERNCFSMPSRFAAQGLWGRGIYFADKASYSKNYSHCPFNSQPSDRPRPEKGELEMFQARLLVGKDVKLDENKSLTVPPTDSSSGLKYNSVTGHTAGSQIWIVYENGRAYPEYLVRYYIGGRDTSRSPYASKAEARISAKRRGSDVGLNELNDPTEKSNSQSHAHRLGSWEYCSDSGWVAYGVFDQILIEKTFQDFSRNKSLPCTCAVKGPEWEYEVNVATMVQTNMQHVSNTQRKIRFHLP